MIEMGLGQLAATLALVVFVIWAVGVMVTLRTYNGILKRHRGRIDELEKRREALEFLRLVSPDHIAWDKQAAELWSDIEEVEAEQDQLEMHLGTLSDALLWRMWRA